MFTTDQTEFNILAVFFGVFVYSLFLRKGLVKKYGYIERTSSFDIRIQPIL